MTRRGPTKQHLLAPDSHRKAKTGTKGSSFLHLVSLHQSIHPPHGRPPPAVKPSPGTSAAGSAAVSTPRLQLSHSLTTSASNKGASAAANWGRSGGAVKAGVPCGIDSPGCAFDSRPPMRPPGPRPEKRAAAFCVLLCRGRLERVSVVPTVPVVAGLPTQGETRGDRAASTPHTAAKSALGRQMPRQRQRAGRDGPISKTSTTASGRRRRSVEVQKADETPAPMTATLIGITQKHKARPAK